MTPTEQYLILSAGLINNWEDDIVSKPRMLVLSSAAMASVLFFGSQTLAASTPATLSVLHDNVAHNLLRQSTMTGSASSSTPTTFEVTLNWRHQNQLQSEIRQMYTPTSPQYHHFLTVSQFIAQFSPTLSEVQSVAHYFSQFGITLKKTSTNRNTLEFTGTYGQIEQALHIQMMRYQHHNQSFTANNQDPSVPANIAGLISGFIGLTNYHAFHSSLANTRSLSHNHSGRSSTSQPQGYSPQQIAQAYQISPLYKSGALGQNQTIAIATLATFKPSDAQYFWKYYHINRGSASLNIVPVDGGYPTGDSGAGSGRVETSLDVERSGSLAPRANILVYEAPNTSQGFYDLFSAVVSQDRAQTMSCSWGEDELLATPAYDMAINNIFMEGAAQGQSLFCASGDSGAYDGYPEIAAPSVDFPASSPYITAAGGTTLPINGQVPIPGGSIPMRTEHGWGWSYLLPYYKNFGYSTEAQFYSVIFPVGSGGGTSAIFRRPFYQLGADFPQTAGRNVPDVALNADPFTGYAIYDTSPGTSYGEGWLNGFGGTSFASPQWAGITATMDSALRAQIGFANPLFYTVFQSPQNTLFPAFHTITKGNNWFYYDHAGYNRVTGLGSPDVYNLTRDILSLTH